MSVKPLIFISLLIVISLGAFAKEVVTPEGLEHCTVCHGSQLKGNINIGAPRLTGLSQWYIERQLQKFKHGIRGAHPEDLSGSEMMSMVSNISEQQVTDIARWATSTDSAKPKSSFTADAIAGKDLFQNCIACHGPNGQGNEAVGAPNLSGLNDWYLLTQMNHFRLGIRGTDRNDIYGQQMQAASGVITSEQDAANLAAYILQLK